MRQKPQPTTFSTKALSFYSGDGAVFYKSPILVSSGDHINFLTHDNGLTTNREVPSGEDENIDYLKVRKDGDPNTTASGTLSNLVESIKQLQVEQAQSMPMKQAKKYRIDLGQNVSDSYPQPRYMKPS